MRVTIGFALVAAAVLASCAHVNIVGPHRDAVSRNDAAQIKRLVLQRRDFSCEVLTIRPLSADAAAVRSAGGFGYHTFTVRRMHGQWKIDDSTVHFQATSGV
jgi:hypothetical protein